MARKCYVQIDGVLYEKGTEPINGLMVIDDIKPYRSMLTGELITSRSKHREHLRQHGVIELGNEPLKTLGKPYQGIPDANPQGRKELIRAQIDAMSHAEFKRAIKRSVDRVKWNSNG
jgi:hypothetical protein